MCTRTAEQEASAARPGCQPAVISDIRHRTVRIRAPFSSDEIVQTDTGSQPADDKR